MSTYCPTITHIDSQVALCVYLPEFMAGSGNSPALPEPNPR